MYSDSTSPALAETAFSTAPIFPQAFHAVREGIRQRRGLGQHGGASPRQVIYLNYISRLQGALKRLSGDFLAVHVFSRRESPTILEPTPLVPGSRRYR